jgi:quinol monooxygenase YgiN
MSGGHAVIVGFTVKDADRPAFLRLLRENARRSVTEEAGCLRFDLVEADGDRGQVWLYEIYADRQAFELHLASPHFREFDGATREMISGKQVLAGNLEENVKP